MPIAVWTDAILLLQCKQLLEVRGCSSLLRKTRGSLILCTQAISRTGRPMVYSLSPGVRATPKMAKEVASLTHMYRVTSDDWDLWWEVLLHFPVARLDSVNIEPGSAHNYVTIFFYCLRVERGSMSDIKHSQVSRFWWNYFWLFHYRDFAAAGLIGAPGLQGGLSWPDLDMLPLGWLTDPGKSPLQHRKR